MAAMTSRTYEGGREGFANEVDVQRRRQRVRQKTKIFNEQNKHVRYMNYSKFLYRPPQNSNVKWPRETGEHDGKFFSV